MTYRLLGSLRISTNSCRSINESYPSILIYCRIIVHQVDMLLITHQFLSFSQHKSYMQLGLCNVLVLKCTLLSFSMFILDYLTIKHASHMFIQLFKTCVTYQYNYTNRLIYYRIIVHQVDMLLITHQLLSLSQHNSYMQLSLCIILLLLKCTLLSFYLSILAYLIIKHVHLLSNYFKLMYASFIQLFKLCITYLTEVYPVV